MIEDKDVTFITTTKYTIWLQHCKEFVQLYFPGSKHVIIDGSVNWPVVWFEYLDCLPLLQSKYFVLLDEDCYLFNREEVIKTIELLDQEGATLAGVPDDFFSMRNFNGVALNPFFIVGDRQSLIEQLDKTPNWRHLHYNEKYLKTTSLKNYNPPKPNYEIFYCMFWAVLEAGGKLLYLTPVDSNDGATIVRREKDGPNICIHAWYSRRNNHLRYQKFVKNYQSLQTQAKAAITKDKPADLPFKTN